jgi:predicted metalloenzyme YecM
VCCENIIDKPYVKEREDYRNNPWEKVEIIDPSKAEGIVKQAAGKEVG